MASMSTADRNKAARITADQIFGKTGDTATLNLADILAAVISQDDALEGLPTALPNVLLSLAQNLNLVLPDPFKTTATQSQKAAMFAITVGVKYGYL